MPTRHSRTARSASAKRKSKWRMAPAARPAAGSWKDLFAPLLFGSSHGPLGDAAHIQINGTQIAMTTDSFVVKPLRFPGGSIGELAINGTVNDLAVSGARAEAIVVSFVLEAGLPTEILEAEVRAMGAGRGKGRRENCRRRYESRGARQGRRHVHHAPPESVELLSGVEISPQSVRPGDKVLLSGPIGDHGITILLARGESGSGSRPAFGYALRVSARAGARK